MRKDAENKFSPKYLTATLVAGLLLISAAQAKEYDGVWFLGLNLDKEIFKKVEVRRAFSHAIDRLTIIQTIVSEEVVPKGVIPPGMAGYDASLEGYAYDVGLAKQLMKQAGVGMNDPRLKNMVLLHTDGVKTVAIAEQISRDLQKIGAKVILKQVSYSDQSRWYFELKSEKYDLFLMGYKGGEIGTLLIGDKKSGLFHSVGCEKIPAPDKQQLFGSYEEALAAHYAPDPSCKPQPSKKLDTHGLLEPLFHWGGSANFTGYKNSRVDIYLDQVEELDPTLTEMRNARFRAINQLIMRDTPVVPLFYIQKEL